MNTKQLAALKQLQTAIVAAETSGLALASVDALLCVFVRAEFAAISRGRSPAECINELSDYWTMPIIDCGAT